MTVHISVCFLLMCAAMGLLAGADPIRTKNDERIDKNVIDNDNTAMERQLEVERYMKELEVFPSGLMMENDEGELVEIELSQPIRRDETEETEEETEQLLEDRVFFRLYTQKNRVDYQPLWLNDREALLASNFNAEKPTHFLTHGWINSANSPACSLIRDAYLEDGDYNVIVVDWSKITTRPYIWAATRVKMVGKFVAKMIDFLEEHANLNTEMTSLTGHSLGAHVMGLAGYNANGTISYVVGLDPALPFFYFAGPGSRISVDDANHVQIIHTNGGLLGYLEPIGHTDFYPNGGTIQLGCLVDIGGVCSHSRSYKLFAESLVTKKGFYGKSCKHFWQYVLGLCRSNSVALMGGTLIDVAKSGKFFLSTKSTTPFAMGRR